MARRTGRPKPMSPIIFWFKDDDYKDVFKLLNYFKED